MGNSLLVTTVTTYRERLHVPLRWWVQGVMFVSTFWLALIVAVPAVWAWAVTAAILALLALAFYGYGSARITVEGGRLQAGSARIEARWLGPAEPLDEEAARRAAGIEADARAFLLLRPYLKRAVKVAIQDPADPTPYWLLSTRRPDVLAAAISSLTGSPADR